MSVLCVHVRRLCVPNIMSLGVCFKKLNLVKVGAFAWCSVKIHVFPVCSLRDDNVMTSKPTWKLKHTNSILEYSEYFCQISSKSLLVILSYTILKFRRFFETQCIVKSFHFHRYSRSYHTKAGQKVLSLTYLNKREMDEHTFIFQHNHLLCQCTVYSDLRVFGCL